MNKYAALLLMFLGLLTACQSPPQTSKSSPPNILIAIADDVSFPHMGAYGCSWIQTPHFDRVAREGLLFQNAYTPNAKCAPSRSIILTGRNSWQLEEAANHVPYFPDKFKTVFEVLAENQYFTGHVAKGWAPGKVGEINGKKRQLVGPAFNTKILQAPTTGIAQFDYAANFEDFLSQKPADKPFCFWYGSLEPHRAYEYGTGVRLGGKKTTDIDDLFGFFPDLDTVRNDVLDYAFELEYFDQHLGKMLAMLEAQGELDNTVVIVTADNGMPFPRVKGQAYERSNHLPLAIMWGKGIKDPGRVIEEFVSFADFSPTLLDLAQIDIQEAGMQAFEGFSLGEILENKRSLPRREHMIIGKERHDVGRPQDQGYPIRGIVNQDYTLLVNFKPDRWPSGNPETGYLNCDGGASKTAILHQRRFEQETTYWDLAFGKRPDVELYNRKNDPDCLYNLARDTNYREIREELFIQLMVELNAQGDPRVLGQGDIFDNYTYAHEANRNFYERFQAGELGPEVTGWVNPDDYEQD
ncbi:MAG: sulfatase [Bacteroidota bacterium]